MADYSLPKEDVDFIRNLLRQGSVKWRGRRKCLALARKAVLMRETADGKPVFKYHWQCAHCRQWFKDARQVEVDHIVEIGPFCGDWNAYLAKMFPSVDKLQVLCTVCHMKKTKEYNSARTRWERKKSGSSFEPPDQEMET